MHSHTNRLSTRQLLSVLAVATLLLVVLSLSQSGPFRSVELAFSDASVGGLSIVPASCPSSPHYAGECSESVPGPGGPGGGGTTVPTVSGNACVIAVSPSTIVLGGNSTLYWNSSYQIFGIPFSTTGTITPMPGDVGGSGSASVSPANTTSYTGIFYPTGSLAGIPESWLTPTTCSTQLTVLQSTPGPTACTQQMFCVGADRYQQQTNCSNSYVDTCPYGCSNGVCLGPGAPTAFIRVRPALVASGSSTTVEWSASLVSSCTVTENNPTIDDRWTTTSGSQTSSAIPSQVIYTLTCQGLNGTPITRTATVNIAPTFDEN